MQGPPGETGAAVDLPDEIKINRAIALSYHAQ